MCRWLMYGNNCKLTHWAYWLYTICNSLWKIAKIKTREMSEPNSRKYLLAKISTYTVFDIWLMLTFPLIAMGLSKIACIPNIADCGGLMIGVPNIEPNTPPLLIVKVPPSMSSTASLLVRAWNPTKIQKKKNWNLEPVIITSEQVYALV